MGTGDTAEHFAPVPILPEARWLAVSADYHTCAIRADGVLFCWGDNGSGELGIGSTTDALVPVEVAPDQRWRSVGTGDRVTCAIRVDGSLWCTGENAVGQLGIGDLVQRTTLTEVMPGSRWSSVDIAPLHGHACGLQADGSLFCWGRAIEASSAKERISPVTGHRCR